MHASKYQLVAEDLLDYFSRIKDLGETLARHSERFTSLSDDIDEIQTLDYKLVLPSDLAAQQVQAQNEKELEEILFVRPIALFQTRLSFSCLNELWLCSPSPGRRRGSS